LERSNAARAATGRAGTHPPRPSRRSGALADDRPSDRGGRVQVHRMPRARYDDHPSVPESRRHALRHLTELRIALAHDQRHRDPHLAQPLPQRPHDARPQPAHHRRQPALGLTQALGVRRGRHLVALVGEQLLGAPLLGEGPHADLEHARRQALVVLAPRGALVRVRQPGARAH
jgi:hypothetical protein